MPPTATCLAIGRTPEHTSQRTEACRADRHAASHIVGHPPILRACLTPAQPASSASTPRQRGAPAPASLAPPASGAAHAVARAAAAGRRRGGAPRSSSERLRLAGRSPGAAAPGGARAAASSRLAPSGPAIASSCRHTSLAKRSPRRSRPSSRHQSADQPVRSHAWPRSHHHAFGLRAYQGSITAADAGDARPPYWHSQWGMTSLSH